jgi:hypothetical protein
MDPGHIILLLAGLLLLVLVIRPLPDACTTITSTSKKGAVPFICKAYSICSRDLTLPNGVSIRHSP